MLIALVIAAVVVVVAVVAIVVTRSDNASAGPQTYPVQVTGTPLPTYPDPPAVDPAVGKVVPTLKGQSLFDGSPMTIAPDGKKHLVAFVAHWCPHCQRDVPIMVQWMASGKKPADLQVEAVATGTNDTLPNYPPSSWLKKADWPTPVMADSSDFTAANAYGLPSYPFLVLFGPDGTVKARTTGEFTEAQLEDFVSKALAA
jgi:thiol-disulfide isomerase/thioredoxin